MSSLVWPTMSSLFFGLVGLRSLGSVLLYVGLALSLAALAMYVRDGLGALRTTRKESPTPSS